MTTHLRESFETMARKRFKWGSNMLATFPSGHPHSGEYMRDETSWAYETWVAANEAKSSVPEGWEFNISSEGMRMKTPFGPGYVPRRANDMGDLLIALCETLVKPPGDSTNIAG